jgi:hypothetical protein
MAFPVDRNRMLKVLNGYIVATSLQAQLGDAFESFRDQHAILSKPSLEDRQRPLIFAKGIVRVAGSLQDSSQLAVRDSNLNMRLAQMRSEDICGRFQKLACRFQISSFLFRQSQATHGSGNLDLGSTRIRKAELKLCCKAIGCFLELLARAFSLV